MIGHYVMTENELVKRRPTPDSVGMGSYSIDSHNIQRYITPEGYVQNEGDIGTSTNGPYEIAYGSLVPKKGQCANLLVPVCVSSSHIAFGSIRMEPVFMILGQSCASAACLAIDDKLDVQDVPYAKLREQLLKDGQILEYKAPAKTENETRKSANRKHIDPAKLDGIVVDDTEAKLEGEWKISGTNSPTSVMVISTTARPRTVKAARGSKPSSPWPGAMKCGSRTHKIQIEQATFRSKFTRRRARKPSMSTSARIRRSTTRL